MSAAQKRELLRIVNAKTSSQREVFRARIILGLARGLSHQEITEEQSVSLLAIGRWRKRWAAKGLEGLQDAPGRGRKPRLSPKAVGRALSLASFATTIPPTSTPKSLPGSSAIPVFTSISSPPLPPGSIWWNASLAKSPPKSSAREAFAASEPWSPTSSAFSIITISVPNPTAGLQTPSASLKNSIAHGRPCSKKYSILFMGRHTSET